MDVLWRPEGNLYSTCGSDGLDADGLPLPPGAVAVAAVLAGLGLLVLLVRGEAVLDRLHRRLPSLRRLKDIFCPFTSQSLMISGKSPKHCRYFLLSSVIPLTAFSTTLSDKSSN